MVELKCNVGSDQYGLIMTENSILFSEEILKYIEGIQADNKEFEEVENELGAIWFQFREKIYSDLGNEDENLHAVVLCFNGEITIDGKNNYFEFH